MSMIYEDQVRSAVAYNDARAYSAGAWRRIQTLVGAHADGVPGAQTARDVADAQRRLGVIADGKCGPGTLRAFDDPGLRLLFSTEEGDPHPISDILEAYPGRRLVIDISYHQKEINWALVRESGVDGVIVKATSASTYVDPQFDRNWIETKRAGLPRGSYWYVKLVNGEVDLIKNVSDPAALTRICRANFTRKDPIAQCEHYVRTLGEDLGELAMFLDLETKNFKALSYTIGPEGAVDWVLEASECLEKLTGARPGLYWSARSIREFLGDQALRLRDHQQWFARYPRVPWPLDKRSEPSKHDQRFTWAMWQYSCRGRVNGIRGGKKPVDLNLVNGTTLAPLLRGGGDFA